MKTEYISFEKDAPNPAMYLGQLHDPETYVKYVFKVPQPILKKAEILVQESYHAEITLINDSTFSVMWNMLCSPSNKSCFVAVLIPME